MNLGKGLLDQKQSCLDRRLLPNNSLFRVHVSMRSWADLRSQLQLRALPATALSHPPYIRSVESSTLLLLLIRPKPCSREELTRKPHEEAQLLQTNRKKAAALGDAR